MYNGYWETDKNYKRGDVIYVCTLDEYYICINDHISDRLTFPNKEDLYSASLLIGWLATPSLSASLPVVAPSLIVFRRPEFPSSYCSSPNTRYSSLLGDLHLATAS